MKDDLLMLDLAPAEVVRTQWLDFGVGGAAGAASLLGKKILIVDEVDDSYVHVSRSSGLLKQCLASSKSRS